jgi:hypothetical protein
VGIRKFCLRIFSLALLKGKLALQITDIPGFDNMAHNHGERYRGWYTSKNNLRKETLLLPNELTYQVSVCDYHYQFIMPSKIEFCNGILTYTEEERKLAVFRFPKDLKGQFCTPVSLPKKDLADLSKEEMEALLKGSVLTFEAFRVPQFGFEFFSISDRNFAEIREITDEGYEKKIESNYREQMYSKLSDVKHRIETLPNYLLILENVLNLRWKNLDEVSFATNNILHK